MDRTTLDIDSTDKELIFRIIWKILGCKDLLDFKGKPSLNGYHITLWCKRPCCKCRLVFDDPVRFDRDLAKRDRSKQDVLWSRKECVILTELLKNEHPQTR